MNDEEQVRVFLWCSPRTISTAFSKCLSFIEGMEVWFEPFVYCFLAAKEGQRRLGVDIPFKVDGNEEIFEKTTTLMREMTGAKIETAKIAYANLKPRLEGTRSKYVLVKDMCLGVSEKTRQFLPSGFRHTFLIRTPERTIESFRRVFIRQYIKNGFLQNDAAEEREFDLMRDCVHMSEGYQIKDVYDFWNYVRNEIEPEPIVIDADDLLAKPREMVKKYCELVCFPFSESLMEWDASSDIIKTWKTCGEDQLMTMEDFFGRAMHSSHFMPPTKPKRREDLTPDVIRGIDETMPFFEEMYKHRLQV